MFKKNTAVVGFTIGLISAADNSDITTGTPVGYYTLDGGTQAAIADVTPVHEGNGQWSFDLTAGEMNGDIVGLVFTHASAITVHKQISTSVDAVWDEVLNKTAHDIAQSAGKRLRALSATVVRQDTAQGSGTGNNQIQFDTGASATDGAYDPSIVSIVDGTGAGQARLILEYDGTTKTATVDRNWKINPDATSEFLIIADAGREHVNEGLAQGGTATSITLNALASSIDDTYVGQTIFIRSGNGDDQAGLCVSYDGATKVADIIGVWSVIPDSTSAYVMLSTSLYDDTAVSNITTGAAAPSTISESRVLTTGSEVNTYTATHVLDGTYHEISDAAGVIDTYYQFDVDDDNVATSVAVNGRLEGADDSIDAYAYNWVTTTWDRIGDVIGVAPGFADIVSVYTVIADYTGTGANLNKIRIRFAGTGLTSATLFIDRVVMRYAPIPAPTAESTAILADTNELQVAHSGGDLGADIDKINGVTITGDGSATPFDV